MKLDVPNLHSKSYIKEPKIIVTPGEDLSVHRAANELMINHSA